MDNLRYLGHGHFKGVPWAWQALYECLLCKRAPVPRWHECFDVGGSG